MAGRLFVLLNGQKVYARESVVATVAMGSTMYIMKASDCVLMVQVKQGHQEGMAVVRCSDLPEKPKDITIPASAVAMLMDLNAPDLQKVIDSTLAGIVAPGPQGLGGVN